MQKIKTPDEASNSVAGALVISILNCGTMGIWGQMTLLTIGHAAATLVSISWMPTARTYAEIKTVPQHCQMCSGRQSWRPAKVTEKDTQDTMS